MKVALDCGHNPPSDLGAISQKHNLAEFVEAHKIVSFAYEDLYEEGFQIVNFAERLKTKVQIINKEKPLPVCAVEVHLNNHSSPEPRGALCLYYPTKKSRLLSEFILDNICDLAGIHRNGVALIKKRGIYVGNFRLDPSKPIIYFLRKTKVPACVVEPLFLSNDEDCELLTRKNIHAIIATGIVKGIMEYVKALH